MITQKALSILIFTVCYAFFVIFPKRRAITACSGAILLVLLGVLDWHDALTDKIKWNVVALFSGTLVLAELFMLSRMPAVIAEWLVDRTRTVRGAMLAVCALSGFISMFVENVAVVLLIAPVALSLAEKLKISPVRLLILIAVCSNLQGTATLIGDPPSMILAGYLGMTFNDFFVYLGRPGIFFAVELGAAASLAVSAYLLRRHNEAIQLISVEKVRSWTPAMLMCLLIVTLSMASRFDPGFKWLAGTIAVLLAVAGVFWFRLFARWGSVRQMLSTLDWDTTFFLIGVFVVVGAVGEAGWLDQLASWISTCVGKSAFGAFAIIVLTSVLVSAFVDNVPFLLAMIPVVQKVADTAALPVPLLMFGLLIGTCLGGNITPIGASANVVVVGMLRKKGHLVSFREFMAVGIPFTVAAVLASCVFVWIIWAR